MIDDADAEALFPDLEYWQRKSYYQSRNDAVETAAEQKRKKDSAWPRQESQILPAKDESLKFEGGVVAAGVVSEETEEPITAGKKNSRLRTNEGKSGPSILALKSLKRDNRGRRPTQHPLGAPRPGQKRERSASPSDDSHKPATNQNESSSRYPTIPSRR